MSSAWLHSPKSVQGTCQRVKKKVRVTIFKSFNAFCWKRGKQDSCKTWIQYGNEMPWGSPYGCVANQCLNFPRKLLETSKLYSNILCWCLILGPSYGILWGWTTKPNLGGEPSSLSQLLDFPQFPTEPLVIATPWTMFFGTTQPQPGPPLQ